MSRGKKQTSNARDKTEYFSWSDDEVELLLSSTMEYKTSKEMENIMLSAMLNFWPREIWEDKSHDKMT